MEIKGKFNTAVCYVKVIDESAVQQIQMLCDQSFAKGEKIRIMPDVHAGKGCTIGTTMTITDKVCPSLVGVDIGCGMYAVPVHKTLDRHDLEKLDEAAHTLPSGMHKWNEPKESFDLSSLTCFKVLKYKDSVLCSLGTLGGGNHFIEVDYSEKQNISYLVIHSGSRNLGRQTAEYYQSLAEEQEKLGGYLFHEACAAVIQKYKEEGTPKLINPDLQALKKKERETSVVREFCCLSGKPMQDYLHDIHICQNFARRNRELIAEFLFQRSGLMPYADLENSWHTVHNYIDTDQMILRKGAVSAQQGEKILIPINMRDGSLIAIGKGNLEWNCSAPHGAGRMLARKQARETLSLKEYQSEMEGIYTTSVSVDTLDEAPMAYKSIDDILDVIGDTVNVIDRLKPVYNFKAQNEPPEWISKKGENSKTPQ